MRYYIKARSYFAYGLRSYAWQSSGTYDIEAANAIVRRMRALAGEDVLGVDVWMVPA